eukprot:scaffold17775_cov94-Skeletonema_dohrnii-CCMP3373.AAC.2
MKSSAVSFAESSTTHIFACERGHLLYYTHGMHLRHGVPLQSTTISSDSVSLLYPSFSRQLIYTFCRNR